MSQTELKRICRIFTFALFLILPYFAFYFASQSNGLYINETINLVLVSELLCVAVFIMSFKDSLLWFSLNLGCGAIVLLVGFDFYFSLFANYFVAQSNIFRVLFLINPLIVIVTLALIRLVFKSPRYINALKTGKYVKYILLDLVIALVQGPIIALFVKHFDSGPPLKFIFRDAHNNFLIILGYIVFAICAVVFIHGIAGYFFTIKIRRAEKLI